MLREAGAAVAMASGSTLAVLLFAHEGVPNYAFESLGALLLAGILAMHAPAQSSNEESVFA